MELIEITDRSTWDEFVTDSPWGHPLQLWGWGETKASGSWTPYRLALSEGGRIVAAVQVLLWKLPKLNKFIVYAPRGPVSEPGSEMTDKLLTEAVKWARAHGGLYVRIEPPWKNGVPRGWRKAYNSIQMRETYTIDLRKSEDKLQEPISRKHRQYIRKAERDGVTVRRVEPGQIGGMYDLYVDTARRAGFGIHGEGYYRKLSQELSGNNYLHEASFEGKPVAFLWLTAAGRTAYELYGGVNAAGGEVKANYPLKWHAIQAMKEAGYEIYDFNGRLNEGVSRFKDGFGPDATDWIGTYDFLLNAALYHAWEKLWPLTKLVGRLLKKFKR
ncbi:MAG: peptidoglycan bridge formation glycyltransferase FemA/FemB family protein [Candidatus Saccharimonadales bacterium]